MMLPFITNFYDFRGFSTIKKAFYRGTKFVDENAYIPQTENAHQQINQITKHWWNPLYKITKAVKINIKHCCSFLLCCFQFYHKRKLQELQA